MKLNFTYIIMKNNGDDKQRIKKHRKDIAKEIAAKMPTVSIKLVDSILAAVPEVVKYFVQAGYRVNYHDFVLINAKEIPERIFRVGFNNQLKKSPAKLRLSAKVAQYLKN